MSGRTIRIGAGAGFSGDRIEPALELLEHGNLDYLAFECLAERTIGLAQAARQENPSAGFDPLLQQRMEAALPIAARRGVRLISNMGAANPLAAANEVSRIAGELGLPGYRTAAVTGDDVLRLILQGDYPFLDRPGNTNDIRDTIVSANAYLGTEGIVEALKLGAQTVITGRGCDPALFLAPLVHEFGWSMTDWDLLGSGTLVGHMLECAGQLCGGYFADPGYKDVTDIANLGFPFADVAVDGTAVFGKLESAGGCLTEATCKEQVLYEILDPSCYLQADVTADFSQVIVQSVAKDRIRVSGAKGKAYPSYLKVSISYEDGFIGEGQISFSGIGAVARGKLALEIVKQRLNRLGVRHSDLSLELIGLDSIDRRTNKSQEEPCEVRARVVARTETLREAERIGAEVEALYTNGPMGGGGVTRSTRRVLAIASTLIDRSLVTPKVQMLEA